LHNENIKPEKSLDRFDPNAMREIFDINLVAFHPGTTHTYLSSPFHSNVAEGKLFSPDFVAGCLVERLDEAEPDGELSFVDWAGTDIPW